LRLLGKWGKRWGGYEGTARDEGEGMRDKGRGTRDEGRGTRDRGRGMRDEGQGTRDRERVEQPGGACKLMATEIQLIL